MHTLIIYHSDYDHTTQIAKAIKAGVLAAGNDADVVKHELVGDFNIDDLKHADVIIFGAPVHMGSMAWQMKKLLDATANLWMEAALEGKVAAAFVTCGGFGGAGGGAEHSLIGLHSHALEHGMLVIGFPKTLPGFSDAGLQWGLCVRTGNHEGMPTAINDRQLLAARSYGSHVRETAGRILRD
ncbi:MAG: flavodoxin domain-containing protein [Mariprofundaceae bacterium]|nr:flavodoxin domain-containing protein [Mariprofundaceae bacterium]